MLLLDRGEPYKQAVQLVLFDYWKMSRKGSGKRPWSEEEDAALKQLYEEMRLNKWSLIADQLAHFGFQGRTGKQCRERYNNHLDPALNREEWAPGEEKKLFQLHQQVGNRWAVISQRLGAGRTDNSVKNHFFSKLRKSLRKLNRIILEDFKKNIRQIQTKVLYKILEACEERFKGNPMCDAPTSEAALQLKNRILMFSCEQEEPPSEQNRLMAIQLIHDITDFNRNYKRKPKKFRRTTTHNQDTLQVPVFAVRRAASNDSFSNSSLAESSDSDSEWDDDIRHTPPYSPLSPLQTRRQPLFPLIARTKSQPEIREEPMVDEKYEQNYFQKDSAGDERDAVEAVMDCSQKLEELGLLEDGDAAIHPLLMKKSTSLFSRRSSEPLEQEIKFFQDSQIEMRIMFAPLPETCKKQSYEEGLFHQ